MRSDLLGAMPLAQFVDRVVAHDAGGMVGKDIVYRRILAEIGADERAAELLLADYGSGFAAHCRPPGDLAPTLARLSRRGLRLGVVTNGPEAAQTRTLEALGLDGAFDVVLISESEGIRKPDPAIFLRALARLGVAPAAAVFVGDNPEADIAGAKAAGLRAVWRSTPFFPPPEAADATIDTLGALAAVLEGWRAPVGPAKAAGDVKARHSGRRGP